MKRLTTSLLILSISMLLTKGISQNLQLHYDYRHSLHGNKVSPGNYLTATFEMFKPDKRGSTFMFVDLDFSLAKGNLGLIYTEIARAFKIGECPILPHVEYNGGLGSGFSIYNSYMAGAAYPFVVGPFFANTYVVYKYNSFNKASHDVQWTLSWTGNFFNNKLTLCGFADVWSENKNRETGIGGKKVIFLSEPQIWYNIYKNLSVGAEVEVSYGFVPGEDGFYALPTTAIKWNF